MSTATQRFMTLFLTFMCLVPPAMAGQGAVSLNNQASTVLQVVDSQGQTIGRVEPGQRLMVGSEEGLRQLKVVRPDGSVYTEATVRVRAGHTERVDIQPTEAVLRVHNHSTRDVTVEIDGRPVARVPAHGSTEVGGIRPGSRWLTARDGDRVVASASPWLPPRGSYLWSLGQTSNAESGVAVLRVRNFAGQPVRVFVNGRYRVELQPGDSSAMVGLGKGQARLEARSRDGRAVSTKVVTLGAGSEELWTVPAPEGLRAVIEVRNTLSVPVNVCVDGGSCLRVRAAETARLDSLPVGLHLFQAYTRDSTRPLESFEAELAAEAPYEWVLEAEAVDVRSGRGADLDRVDP